MQNRCIPHGRKVRISDSGPRFQKRAFAVIPILECTFPKQAMEMTPWKSLRDYHISMASTAGVFRSATARETEFKAFKPQGSCNGCFRYTSLPLAAFALAAALGTARRSRDSTACPVTILVGPG